MKKRLVATILILSMALSGCGSNGSADTAAASPQKAENTRKLHQDAFSDLVSGGCPKSTKIFSMLPSPSRLITLETLRRKNLMQRQKKVISTLLL